MEVLRGLESVSGIFRGLVLTIGNFDGVHAGHAKIFARVMESARRRRGTSMAITFDPHPMKVISPERQIKLLTPTEEKLRLIAHRGIDRVLLINFNREFANLRPDDFIKDVLVDKLGVSEVIVGHNYAFGRGKKGTTALLRRRGDKYGFDVHVVRNARMYETVVSSSRIRSLLSRGRVCEASLLLGRPYMIAGRVIRGAGRGAAILKTPTANITTPNELVPKEGVYAVVVRVGGRDLRGVANIGTNPTFHMGHMNYEVHIFDFDENLLGRDIGIYFIDRIRDERTFPDAESLHAQIREDVTRARHVLATKKYLRPI